MRRSKSNPAKAVRNYRSVSQRRMTNSNKNQDDVDSDAVDQAEMERLRKVLASNAHVLRNSTTTTEDHNGKNSTSKAQEMNGKDEEEEDISLSEMERLRQVLASDAHVVAQKATMNDDDDATTTDTSKSKNEKDQYKKRKSSSSSSSLPDKRFSKKVEEPSSFSANDGATTTATTTAPVEEPEHDYYGQQQDNDENPLVCLSKKQRGMLKQQQKESSSNVELTPEEIRQAKLAHKNAQRKLRQLEQRAAQTKKRKELYTTLQHTAIDETQRCLLQSSATLGKRITKRQELQRLLLKERSGLIPLTDAEKDLLYQDRNEVNDNCDDMATLSSQTEGISQQQSSTPATATTVTTATSDDSPDDDSPDDDKDASIEEPTTSKKKRKRKRKKAQDRDDRQGTSENIIDAEKDSSRAPLVSLKKAFHDDSPPSNNNEPMEEEEDDDDNEHDDEAHQQSRPGKKAKSSSPNSLSSPSTTTEAKKPSSSASSFAAQMMASLSQLKTDSAKAAEEKQAADAAKAAEEERKRLELEEAERKKRKRHVPTNPTIVKTAAKLGLSPSSLQPDSIKQQQANYYLPQIIRPAVVQTARMSLPIAEMEFEVMDAIRNHDVTIICGECGSGKSTQIPQFLYEAGMTTATSHNGNGGENQQKGRCMIGVTQPRRVAAVSTAKRVCFEMGQGNGQIIPNTNKGKDSGKKGGNLVAYQTRYETAGLDESSTTHIKFMTDGILLQEIQSDLLLRKYSVIVLDEAHERNLNTDVLIGLLLSATLPLRRQAALEEEKEASSSEATTLRPLKLVIMSATLRVQDFTENTKLFASIPTQPAVVRIPGRTFPVTIHHSKVTEMEQYEDVALRKICKIHRRLPPGGILVFLTGKQEILTMVRKLRRILNKKNTSNVDEDERLANALSMAADVRPIDNVYDGDDAALRDMDDDEVDGDLFRDEEDGGDLDVVNELKTESKMDESKDGEKDESASGGPPMPDKVLVLPLYSLMAPDEQAKVFAPVPEGHRLIVVATNIAETSITIPGISYVVDSGRIKCRNYNAGTGVASFDIMWVSRAAADQRAGRAGRTGPGHCYRLYSSSMYSRHMDGFALPEVLNRPLEDVVLAMKAMKISNVADFAFPTPPSTDQLDAAVKLLANVGCVDKSDEDDFDNESGDGIITRLGAAVSRLPLGVRYGKMLLVAAEAGVLDYAIVMVAALSESNPFIHHGQQHADGETSDLDDEEDEKDATTDDRKKKRKQHRWTHRGGDVMAIMLAVGAYTYAGRNGDRASRKFCEDNGLNAVVMSRIQKMRIHLARLAKARLSNADGVAAKTGGILTSMKPPNKVQERLLSQAIASGLLDNVAMLAPLGSIPSDHGFSMRTAYIGCSTKNTEPLFMDSNSVLYSRDSRLLPKWICFDYLMRKQLKNGTPIAIMKNVTPIDPSWLGVLAKGSRLLSLGEPLPSPPPMYDAEKDAIVCSVLTKFGHHGWQIPSVRTDMYDALQGMKKTASSTSTTSQHFLLDDSFRWFARFLLEGKILPELAGLEEMLNDSPTKITRRTPVTKVALLVSACASAGVDSAAALRKHWATVDDKFLFSHLKSWILADRRADAKKLWIETVKQNVRLYKRQQQSRR